MIIGILILILMAVLFPGLIRALFILAFLGICWIVADVDRSAKQDATGSQPAQQRTVRQVYP